MYDTDITTDYMFLHHTFLDSYQESACFYYRGRKISLWWVPDPEVLGAFGLFDPRSQAIVADITHHADKLIANPDMTEEEKYTPYGFIDWGWNS